MPTKLKWYKHAPYKGETDVFESLGRHQNLGVAQLAERVVWADEAVSLSLTSRTSQVTLNYCRPKD